jgi:hypothetical protein
MKFSETIENFPYDETKQNFSYFIVSRNKRNFAKLMINFGTPTEPGTTEPGTTKPGTTFPECDLARKPSVACLRNFRRFFSLEI